MKFSKTTTIEVQKSILEDIHREEIEALLDRVKAKIARRKGTIKRRMDWDAFDTQKQDENLPEAA